MIGRIDGEMCLSYGACAMSVGALRIRLRGCCFFVVAALAGSRQIVGMPAIGGDMQPVIGRAWLAALVCVACGGQSGKVLTLTLADGGTALFGEPCRMSIEDDPTFSGFSLREVSIESQPGHALDGPVCLALAFQGRASCPYGQSSDAGAGLPPCLTPMGQPVRGLVPTAAQCVDRRADQAVTWSCRCDGVGGCQCPSDSACVALGFSGEAYCVKTWPSGSTSTCQAVCDPIAHPCN